MMKRPIILTLRKREEKKEKLDPSSLSGVKMFFTAPIHHLRPVVVQRPHMNGRFLRWWTTIFFMAKSHGFFRYITMIMDPSCKKGLYWHLPLNVIHFCCHFWKALLSELGPFFCTYQGRHFTLASSYYTIWQQRRVRSQKCWRKL